MQTLNIFLEIFIPTLAIFFFAFFIIKWMIDSFSSRITIPSNGTLFYYFDLQARKLKNADTSFVQKNFLFYKWKPEGWVNVDVILKRIEDADIIHKKLRAAYNNLEKGSNFERITFTYSTIAKKNIYNFDIEFRSMEDYSTYIVKIRWNMLKSQQETAELSLTPLQKPHAPHPTLSYKGFVVFNVRRSVENAHKKLISIIRQFWKNELHYYIKGNFLILIFHANSNKKIRKKIDHFIALFKKYGYEKGGGLLFKGSAWTYSSQINTKKNWNHLLQTLEFLIIQSIEEKNNFVSHLKNVGTIGFKKFVGASKIFRGAIKTEHIDLVARPIRLFTNDKKVSEYIEPKISAISEKMMRKLLISYNNSELLRNKVAWLIGVDKKVYHQAFVDVNSDWLIQNVYELTNRKPIYVINHNIQKSASELQETIRDLKNLGFSFAFRIFEYSEEIATLIKMIDPEFVIVALAMRNHVSHFDSALTINLMSLNQICVNQNIKIIYESPPQSVDEMVAEKIGLQFYY